MVYDLRPRKPPRTDPLLTACADSLPEPEVVPSVAPIGATDGGSLATFVAVFAFVSGLDSAQRPIKALGWRRTNGTSSPTQLAHGFRGRVLGRIASSVAGCDAVAERAAVARLRGHSGMGKWLQRLRTEGRHVLY